MDQNVAKNHVVDVADADEIATAINKQKVSSIRPETQGIRRSIRLITVIVLCTLLQSVVRELELRKPQLDELITTSEALRNDTNRQKLQSRGMKLRIIIIYAAKLSLFAAGVYGSTVNTNTKPDLMIKNSLFIRSADERCARTRIKHN